MKIVIVTICLISLMIVVFLGVGVVGFLGLAGGEMAIDGFSDTLIDGLYEQYGITVPEDAKFIKGLYSRTMNESYLAVLFECPLNDAGEDLSKYVYGLLKLDKKGYRSASREYAEIDELLERSKERSKEDLEELTYQINQVLAADGISVRTQVRHRMPYSIWRKMRTKGCDFEHIEDKHYIRIIFKDDTGMSEKNMSLRIYSLLTDHFKERPGSFSNYIDAPKENGYESLHIKILNSKGTWEEIHIASERMVRKSRLGCAAEQTGENLTMWLENFKDVLKKVADDSANSNFLDEVRLLFEYNDDIMVFTPAGENIVLPKGATALDYAFHIHGEVGEHARFARINGKLSSVKTVLRRGDCVEIGLGDDIQIRENWQGHMVTYKAKKAVKSYLAKQPKPDHTRCSCCNPLPGDEIIGYGEDPKHLTLHKRDCPELIRLASQHGNHIHEAELHERNDTLYPVRLIIRAVDRYHLLSDLIDCITEKLKLSMIALSTETIDNIGTCTIDFSIHSADELRFAINSIKEIESVDEVYRTDI